MPALYALHQRRVRHFNKLEFKQNQLQTAKLAIATQPRYRTWQ
ncbi:MULTISPECIES: hypothetical protein [Fischerella]|nr:MULTISPECIES: hypothetical protein [Fischerella]